MRPIQHLVIGKGYLGHRLITRLDPTTTCFTNRHKAPALETDAHALALDVNNPDSWKVLEDVVFSKQLVVYQLIPPSQIDIDIFPRFLARIDGLPAYRRILASSTVVYGQTERVVDADSEVDLDSLRAKRQHAIEAAWLNSATSACVVRFAGLYGPQRIIGLKSVTSGQPINGNGQSWLNLIHIDDAAALLQKLATLSTTASHELGSDGTPLRRLDYYNLLADLTESPAPLFHDDGLGMPGRRCQNDLTVARTGWKPEHDNIRAALSALINEDL